jgi:hypothetical protein
MAKHTIKLKNYVNIFNEYVASAAITPGHLIELLSTGKVQSHSTAGGRAAKLFALEDELQGNGIADAYVADYPVQCWSPVPGDEVNALLKNGEHAYIGSFLESAGDGTLQVHVADSGSVTNVGLQIVGVAIEEVDMTDSSGADPTGRIAIRIV